MLFGLTTKTSDFDKMIPLLLMQFRLLRGLQSGAENNCIFQLFKYAYWYLTYYRRARKFKKNTGIVTGMTKRKIIYFKKIYAKSTKQQGKK